MKPKDATFIQLHVEKLILLGGALFLVIVVLYFVLGSPFAVELDNQSVAPTKVPPRIQDAAQRLDRRLSSDHTPIPRVRIPSYAKVFQRDYQQPLLAAASLPVPLSQPGTRPGDISTTGVTYAQFDVPSPPLPTGLATESSFALLAPQQFERPAVGQAVVKMIGNPQPPDFPYASVSGTFNMDQWVARLQQGSGKSQIPRKVWSRKLGIAGVYLQRQRQDPVTGEWGQTTIIKPLPGQFGYLPSNQRQWDPDRAVQTIRDLRTHQGEVARPGFVPTANQTPWLPPGTRSNQLSDQDIRKLQNLNHRIDNLRAQLARAKNNGGGNQRNQQNTQRLQDRLKTLVQQKDQLLKVDQGEGANGNQGGGNTGGSNGGGRFGGPHPSTPPSGGGRFGGPHPPTPPSGGGGPHPPSPPSGGGRSGGSSGGGGGGSQPGQPQPKTNLVKVWGHDLTVEPGATYRYRLLVSVINPLFQLQSLAPEQKKQYFDRIALGPSKQELHGATWSQPVRVSPRSYFFAIQANTNQNTARVEVWRIDRGRWKDKVFTVAPGDPIGKTVEMPNPQTGMNRKLDMSTGDVMVDLSTTSGGQPSVGSSAHLLYLNPGTGRIDDRSVDKDRGSDLRKKLQAKQARERMFSSGGGGANTGSSG